MRPHLTLFFPFSNIKSTHRAYEHLMDAMFGAFTRVVVASPLPDASWYSAAEAAIAALYVLHPAPEHVCAAILRRMAVAAFATAAAGESADTEESGEAGGPAAAAPIAADADLSSFAVRPLSRFFFALGHVALQHLVLVERCAKAVRRARHEAEKKSAEDRAARADAARAGKKSAAPDEDVDINAERGVGSVAADAELDAMVDGITGAIAQNAPLTIGLAKAAAREIAKPESQQDHAKLEKMAEACFDSDDFKEGRRAFMEKRKPMFKGR